MKNNRSSGDSSVAVTEVKGCAVIYARCSDEKQVEKNLSVPAQIEACLRFVHGRGFTKHEVFTDEGITGTKDKRPGFQGAIKYSINPEHGVTAFVVYDTSRFSRNRLDAALYKLQLRDAGVEVFYTSQPIGNDEDGELLEGLLELLDARYSKKLARVVLRGMLHKVSRGEAAGGRAPYGYRKVGVGEAREAKGTHNLDPVESQAVKLMFQLARCGIGKRAICERLTHDGFRRRNGQVFIPSVVDLILRNPAYTGLYVFNRRGTGLLEKGEKKQGDWVQIEDYYPPLIAPDEWTRLQTERSSRAPRTPAGVTPAARHRLTGLLFHADCGATMAVERARGRGKKDYLYYVCSSKKMRGTEACEGLRLRAEDVERVILDHILGEVLSAERIEGLVRRLEQVRGALVKNAEGDRRKLAREITVIDEKISKLVDLNLEGALDVAVMKQKIEELTQRKAKIQERQGALPQVGDVRFLRIPMETIEFYRDGLKELIQERDPRLVRAFLARFVVGIKIRATGAEFAISFAKGDESRRNVAGSSNGTAWLPELGTTLNLPCFSVSRDHGLFPTRRCAAPRCGRAFYAKSFCKPHYKQLQRGTLKLEGPAWDRILAEEAEAV